MRRHGEPPGPPVAVPRTSGRRGPHQGQPVLRAGVAPEEARAAMVLLHGRGADARDILGLAAELDRGGFAYLARQAADNTWYPNSFLAPLASNEPGLSSGLTAIAEVLAGLEEAASLPGMQRPGPARPRRARAGDGPGARGDGRRRHGAALSGHGPHGESRRAATRRAHDGRAAVAGGSLRAPPSASARAGRRPEGRAPNRVRRPRFQVAARRPAQAPAHASPPAVRARPAAPPTDRARRKLRP